MSHPADWYPDPAGDQNLVRYWDGSQWTEHTARIDGSVQPSQEQATSSDSSAAVEQPVAAEQPAEPEQPAPPVAQPAEPEQPAPPVAQPAEPEQSAPPVAQPEPPVAQPAPPVAPSQVPMAQPAPPVTSGRNGFSGIRSDLLSGEYSETDANARVTLQNNKMLKVRLGEPVLARQGSMVAFQGQVDFEHEGSGGLGKFLKKAATGEGVPLMRCSGQGELFLAHEADQVHILHLDGSALSVNGKNILAFETSLEWDIQRVPGAGMLTGGLFNTRLSGHGWVAITTKGQPVVLHTDQPTFGDPDAVVAWSADLQTSLNKTVKAKALVGLGSGEAFQVAFAGQGIVIVQPAESGVPSHSHG